MAESQGSPVKKRLQKESKKVGRMQEGQNQELCFRMKESRMGLMLLKSCVPWEGPLELTFRLDKMEVTDDFDE